jgi:hypothetical protein
LLVVVAFLIGCGGSSATVRPQQSLAIVDYSPLPTLAAVRPSAIPSPHGSALAPSWPIGWDVSFCTAFADLTVAHQLVIDIERAISDNNRTDAQGLSNELAQTGPVASDEVTGLKDWEPAAELKTQLTNILDLDVQAAHAYQSYFNDDVKTALKQARQLRTQVSKAVDPANAQLQQLAALGLRCPGQNLTLETF